MPSASALGRRRRRLLLGGRARPQAVALQVLQEEEGGAEEEEGRGKEEAGLLRQEEGRQGCAVQAVGPARGRHLREEVPVRQGLQVRAQVDRRQGEEEVDRQGRGERLAVAHPPRATRLRPPPPPVGLCRCMCALGACVPGRSPLRGARAARRRVPLCACPAVRPLWAPGRLAVLSRMPGSGTLKLSHARAFSLRPCCFTTVSWGGGVI